MRAYFRPIGAIKKAIFCCISGVNEITCMAYVWLCWDLITGDITYFKLICNILNSHT